MLIIFVVFIIGVAITYFIGVTEYRNDYEKGNNFTKNWGNTTFCSIVCAVALTVTWVAPLGNSYGTYVKSRAFWDATREQYAEAVQIYSDHATIDMGKATFTDFRYQGYQDNISGMISTLRREIVQYNQKFVAKRTMGKNPFFSWMIVEPDDDMKIIKMRAPTAGMPE